MTFLTIRQAAKRGILSEHRLRALVAQGRCPGVYSGSRFLVNVEALIRMLEDASARGERL